MAEFKLEEVFRYTTFLKLDRESAEELRSKLQKLFVEADEVNRETCKKFPLSGRDISEPVIEWELDEDSGRLRIFYVAHWIPVIRKIEAFLREL